MITEMEVRKHRKPLFRIKLGRRLEGAEAREFMEAVNGVPLWSPETHSRLLAIAKRFSLLAEVIWLGKRRST